MHQPDRAAHWVHKKDGTAIGHVDSEQHARLVRHQTVTSIEPAVSANRIRDYCDLAAVNLFRRSKRQISNTECLADTAVNAVEATERLGLVARDVDPSHASNECMLNPGTDSSAAKRSIGSGADADESTRRSA
jgi:hypothetical protein